MSLKSFPAQVGIYTAVIFAVMFWSGWSVEKTIYDRYLVHNEGSIIPVTDRNRALKFYHGVLDFPTIAEIDGQVPGVILPDGSKLLFRNTDPTRPASSIALVKVRNAFRKFQRTLVARSGRPEFRNTRRNYLEEMEPGMMSEIVERRWGEEFIACDQDGNRIVFFKPSRRSGSRY